MKIAVTGACGFIGRHVVAELERRGVDVVAVLRPGRQRPSWLPASVQVTHLDIADVPADAFSRLGSPDGLVHLAWGGLPNYRSLHHFEAELPAQYRFLGRLVESGLQRLLVTGTCFEYGMQSGELREDMDAAPANPYALAKDALRKQLTFLRERHPFQFTWARLFYMYGEGQAPNSLYPQLKRAAAAGQAEFPMSGGEQLRDYLPVESVVRHLAALVIDRGDDGIVNVCSGQPVSVRSLVERWIAENAWSIAPQLGHYPYPDYEPLAFWGSSEKLRHCLSLP